MGFISEPQTASILPWYYFAHIAPLFKKYVYIKPLLSLLFKTLMGIDLQNPQSLNSLIFIQPFMRASLDLMC